MPKVIPNLLIILFILCPLFLKGQLQRGSADFSDTTNYRIDGGYDSLFIFFADNTFKYIEANSPNGDTVDFEWAEYNPSTGNYDFLSSARDTFSRLNIDENQGYRMVISGAGVNDTSRCWALIDNFSVVIEATDSISQDNEWVKTISTANKWCHLIRDINATIDSAGLYYYNPQSGDRIDIQDDYTIARNSWSANPVTSESGINRFIQNDNYWLEVDVQNPYWEDSWYKLTIEDQFGFERSDSIYNETIEPHAEFEYRYIHLGDSIYYPGRSDNYYDLFYNSSSYTDTSAPALYHFKNLSVNADSMVWYFGDKLSAGSDDDSVMHTYQLPGSYEPMLVVYSMPEHLYDACTDTFPKSNDLGTIEYPIIVSEASILENNFTILPNVFSCPNGSPDRINNLFRFLNDVSITDFEIVIYNRYGKRVYHYKGNIRDWEGWDGHDKGSGSYVQTGVYYYVVKEMEVLPDFETGYKVRLPSYNNQENDTGQQTGNDRAANSDQSGTNAKTPKNTIYYGFVHVYNNE